MSDKNDTHTATEHRGTTTAEDAGTVDITALRRKVDWHIVPLMFACYLMQFLDKVILNYAAVMGLRQDLDLQGNDFSNIAMFLFVGFLCFEVVNGSSGRQMARVKRHLMGVATACGAASHNYRTLVVTQQAPRFSFWYTGLGIGQILGGVISYGFQHIAPGQASLAGCRIMFVTLGCVTVTIGLSTAIFIPDTPMQAGWLSDADKVALLKHVSINQNGIQSSKFRPKEILEALCDPQLYLMLLSVVLLSVSSGVVTTYSATLIANLGYDSKHAALMNMPSGAVSIFFTLLVGFGIRKQSHRWAWIIGCLIPAYVPIS
ncbi:unnamed protein product [Clonostachys chloroleuca]|uniref:Uncharacterized protein n=1 Tax=Clonostachys chloroleuca TaxID=1926264 RepID=A0AA35MI06_9HYPO|nr:unnamed protein product [Clonostachys chloroleuca]